MIGLTYPYLQVSDGVRMSYGGSQMRSDSAVIRKCGCGPVAALDTLWYLKHRGQTEAVTLTEYNAMLSDICCRYFPLVPPCGINGIAFTVGMNRLFNAQALPYQASWMLSGSRLWERSAEMLSRDIPVILSVGPNFPAFWQNNRLPFYIKSTAEGYRRAAATKGHFVTATGIDSDWVRISSWGCKYYINRAEYEHYTRKNSLYIFSNLLYLREV